MINNNNLKNLLSEYSQKRIKALNNAENKKNEIYNKFPDLKDIDNKISAKSIILSKSILNNIEEKNINKLKLEIENLKNQKKEILNKNNISINEFIPKYECSICNDTGYVTNNYKTHMCNCLKQRLYDLEYNDLNVFNISNQNFNNFNFSVYSSKIDKEKYNSNISPLENIKIIKKISESFIANFDSIKEKNLLFIGNSGLGKTFLSNCIANELIKKGKTVLYQTSPIMLNNIIDYKFGKNTNTSNIYNNLLNVDLLIIDDLGTENINSFKFEELFTIINSRLLPQKNRSLKTLISTNLNLKELSSLYGERIVSRFAGNYNICYFFGDDIRINKK